jgi:hypothetical protein
MQLNMMFFDKNNSLDLAEKLNAMEYLCAHDSDKNTLPDRSFLEKYSCNEIAVNFWEVFRERIHNSILKSNGQGL